MQNLSALNSPLVRNAAVQLWWDVWQQLTADRKAFEPPLGFLDAAISGCFALP
jgi:hypothetical protein